MVSKYECDDKYDALLPLPPSVQFTRDGVLIGESLPPVNLYSSLVGSRNHLSQCTRPDILYAGGVQSRYLKCPCAAHLGAAVYPLRDVTGTQPKKLVHETESGLEICADALYRRGPDVCLTTRHVIIMHAAAVACGTKLQMYTALSTTEAETITFHKYVTLLAFEREFLFMEWSCML